MKDMIKMYKELEDNLERRKYYLSLKLTNPKLGVESIRDRISLLQRVMDALREGLQAAKNRWDYKVETMNGMGWEKDKPPIGDFKENIAKITGKLLSSKGEFAYLKDFIKQWESAQHEISVMTAEPKPLMFCNAGKMRGGILHSWDSRLVMENKEGVWIFKDDPDGENLEEYRERIRQAKMKVNADKEKAAVEYNRKNPAVFI